jgi:lipopolysaccharide transport system permease protein
MKAVVAEENAPSLRNYLDIVLYKAYADLKADVSRTYLGYLWWLIEPAIFIAVFWVVFGGGLQGGGTMSALFLTVGVTFWKWFAGSVQHSMMVLVNHRYLLQQVYLPKAIFPLSVLVCDFTKFAVVLLVVLAVVAGVGPGVSRVWWALPILILAQALLNIGVAIIVASITPFVPDLRFAIDNLLFLMMFLSGIFFDLSTLPPTWQQLLSLNPMERLLGLYRGLLLAGQWPALVDLGYVVAWGVLTLGVGGSLLRRWDRLYPKVLSE